MSTMLGIDLRSGAVADLAIVDRIMQAAFDARFGEAWTHNQVLGLLAMPGVWLTIAEVGGEPAGFALCRRVLEEAELLLLATAPHLRRRGVAAALLRAVASDASVRFQGSSFPFPRSSGLRQSAVDIRHIGHP